MSDFLLIQPVFLVNNAVLFTGVHADDFDVSFIFKCILV